MNSARTFLESFRERNTDSDDFFYGLEKAEPYSSLLFRRQKTDKSASPPGLRKEVFKYPMTGIDLAHDEMRMDSGQINFSTAILRMVSCAAEAYTRRISAASSQCTLCGKKFAVGEHSHHMLNHHSEFICSVMDQNIKVWSDDSDKIMSGIFGKLQFDQALPRPKRMYPSIRKHLGTIPAPPVKEDVKGMSLIPRRHDFTMSGVRTSVLNHFIAQHAPTTPPFDGRHEDEDKIEQQANEIFAKTYSAEYNKIERKPPPSTPPKVSRTQSAQVPAPQTPPASGGKRQSKPTPVRSGSKSPARTPSLTISPDVDDDMLDVKTAEVGSKQTPVKRQPRYVSFMETIPAEIRDEVIDRISKNLLSTFAVQTMTQQVIPPLLANKKKQYQKQMRTERVRKAKDEEKRRIDEMRERRRIAINKMSEEICNPLIRSFIRQEITSIFEEELKDANEENVTDPIEGDSEQQSVPAVVISGLLSHRHLNLSFLRDHFSRYRFALDDDGSPKIRFRSNGNRCDVLLYFASMQDATRLVAQKTCQIEYATVRLSLDQENPEVETFKSFTGQEVRIVQQAKNLENFSADRGRVAFCKTMPVLAVENLLDDAHDQ